MANIHLIHIMEVHHIRAALNMPDELMREAQKATGARTKAEAIVIVLKEVLRQRSVRDLIALRGKVEIHYDWEAEETQKIKALSGPIETDRTVAAGIVIYELIQRVRSEKNRPEVVATHGKSGLH